MKRKRLWFEGEHSQPWEGATHCSVSGFMEKCVLSRVETLRPGYTLVLEECWDGARGVDEGGWSLVAVAFSCLGADGRYLNLVCFLLLMSFYKCEDSLLI